MPTSDMRTHASITIPLSSTRSNTSIRLHVLGGRLTATSVSRRADNGFAVAMAARTGATHKCWKTFSACLDLPRRGNGRKHDACKAVDRPQVLRVERIVKPQAQYKARTDAGLLMSFGVGMNNFGRLAGYVDRFLKGARPSDLPIEEPDRLQTHLINLKPARALSLTIPPSLLLR